MTFMRTGSSTIKEGKLVIVCGPSGAGKSTLTGKLITETEACMSISATTRPMGPKDVDGKDYFFMTEEIFKAKINDNAFWEYAKVFGNYYGTPRALVLKMLQDGKTVILEIDIQGAIQIFKKYPKAIGILVLPPTMDTLRDRITSRKRDTQEVIEKRLAKAVWEIDQAKQSGFFAHEIINDDIDIAYNAVIKIVNQ